MISDVICLSETENTVKKVDSASGSSQVKSSSNNKRLKQARLPFAVLNQKLTRQPTVTELFAPKKRKLSGDVNSLTSPKLIKCGNDKDDHGTKQKSSAQDVSEDEVSSSTADVEAVIKVPEAVAPSEKSKDFLRRFLKRKSQQDDVSTSVIDSTLDGTTESAVQTDVVIIKNVEVGDANNVCSGGTPQTSHLTTKIQSPDASSEHIEQTDSPSTATPLSSRNSDNSKTMVEIICSDSESDYTSEPESDELCKNNNDPVTKEKVSGVSKPEQCTLDNDIDKLAVSDTKVENSAASPMSVPNATLSEPTKRPADDISSSAKSKKPKRKLTAEEKAKRVEDKAKRVEEKTQRLEEQKRKRLEREQQLEEQRRLRKEAKEQKEKEKNAALARKKEEQEKKAREKQERLQQKEEERKKKQEENEAKQEKKKKGLDKSLREEEKLRVTEKSKAAFASFFVKKDGTPTQLEAMPHQGIFKPFEVKDNMRVAPLVRAYMEEENLSCLDEHLKKQDRDILYLDEIWKKARQPGKCSRTWPPEDNDDIVELSFEADVLPVTKPKMPRAKMLKFHENVRPPYWGTWQKTSTIITARNPLGKDNKLFDYEVDSDDEWEEEEPGESLSGTEDEKESEDDYEVDNEFFVPHGYLSDEENKDEDEEITPPDMQKAKLKMKEMEFEEEMKKKTQQIKPKVLGCIWMGDTKAGHEELLKVLKPFEAMLLLSTPITTSAVETKEDLQETPPRLLGVSKMPSANKGVKQPVPEEAMPDLIKLLHGNKNNRFLLAREFMKFWNPPVEQPATEPVNVTEQCEAVITPHARAAVSKRQLGKTIREIAVYQKCPQPGVMRGKCWCVHTKVLEKYGLTNLSLPNTWQYVGEQSNASNVSVLFGSPSSLPPVVNTPSVADLLNNPISYNKSLTAPSEKQQLNLVAQKILDATSASCSVIPVTINIPIVDSINTSSSVSIFPIASSGEPVKVDGAKSDSNIKDLPIISPIPAMSTPKKRIKPIKVGESIAKFFRPSTSGGSVDSCKTKMATSGTISATSGKADQKVNSDTSAVQCVVIEID